MNKDRHRTSPSKKEYKYSEDRDALLRLFNILVDMQRSQLIISAIIGILLLGIFFLGLTYLLRTG